MAYGKKWRKKSILKFYRQFWVLSDGLIILWKKEKINNWEYPRFCIKILMGGDNYGI